MINNSQINFGRKYCYIPKCKAICCTSAPLPIETLQAHKNDTVRKTIINYRAPLNNRYCKNAVVPLTTYKALTYQGKNSYGRNKWKVNLRAENNYCPFLRKDYRCNIYEDRPPICRSFGSKGGRKCPGQVTLAELIMLKTKSALKNAFSYLFNLK